MNEQQVIVRRYIGSQSGAMQAYQEDSAKMAAAGYYPTSQVWTPGEYGCGSFLVALLLCLILIGILIFIYMLIVKPDGTLTVTYEFRNLNAVFPTGESAAAATNPGLGGARPSASAPASQADRLRIARFLVAAACIIAGAISLGVLQFGAACIAIIALLMLAVGWSIGAIQFRYKVGFAALAVVLVTVVQGIEVSQVHQHEAALQKIAAKSKADAQLATEEAEEAFKKMTPAQHLSAAKAELKAGAPGDQVIDAMKQIDAIKGTKLEYQGEALRSQYEAATKRAEKAAEAEAEKEAALNRDSVARSIEEGMLAEGYSVDVNAIGPNHTTLRFKWALVSKAFAYQVANSAEIMDKARSAGFKKMVLTDGYEEVWTLNL